ncbi:hypothetical protein ON010_g17540 [Phytophthora cinnamomi]|nr:hypothetical protein ON010_g17540 [Phytophthora cinnamomi]
MGHVVLLLGSGAVAVEPPHAHRLDAAVERGLADAHAAPAAHCAQGSAAQNPHFRLGHAALHLHLPGKPEVSALTSTPLGGRPGESSQVAAVPDFSRAGGLIPPVPGRNGSQREQPGKECRLCQEERVAAAPLTAVYDITMFYVDYAANERPSEASLLTGRVPRMIHFYIERVDISALRDKSESELATWMEQRFERKESMLKAFYESNGKLPDGAELLFQENQGPALTVLVMFWLVLIGAATICGLIGNLMSVAAAIAIIAGYTISTAYGSGVDGFLIKNL